MPDSLETLITRNRKEWSSSEAGTIAGDVIALCDIAEVTVTGLHNALVREREEAERQKVRYDTLDAGFQAMRFIERQKLEAQRDSARQALWEIAGMVGEDLDGDESHKVLTYPSVEEFATEAVHQYVADVDEADELATSWATVVQPVTVKLAEAQAEIERLRQANGEAVVAATTAIDEKHEADAVIARVTELAERWRPHPVMQKTVDSIEAALTLDLDDDTTGTGPVS
jgi:hypothetical protein